MGQEACRYEGLQARRQSEQLVDIHRTEGIQVSRQMGIQARKQAVYKKEVMEAGPVSSRLTGSVRKEEGPKASQ